MRKNSFPRNRQRWIAFSGAALGLLLIASSAVPAHAGDDDDWIDSKLGGILEGIGLRRDGDKTIDYRERSPLVIPSNTTQLPPPEKTDGLAAANPNWPKDPDVMRAQQQAKFEKNRNIVEETAREQNPLSPSQLTPGGKSRRVNTSNVPGSSASGYGFSDPMSPSELGYHGGFFGLFGSKGDQAARFTGEPARTSLVEPPSGYQTPSPVEPYGPPNAGAPKAENYSLHHGELGN
jgi:hypothetical protein